VTHPVPVAASALPARLIAARGVHKRYGGEAALDSVDLELHEGEILALLGENGAGKSTLIKVLAGVVARDEGELEICGSPMATHFAPTDVAAAGLAFVHQDLGLLDHLSVSENIALARGYPRRRGLISFARTRVQALEVLQRLDLAIDPDVAVGELSQDQKVMVAVARAFSLNARAIVLDEVSSSLPAPGVARLLESLRASSRRGIGYIYVTHRLSEVTGLADRVSVLRDGRLIATARGAEIDHDRLVEWIVGAPPSAPTAPAPDRAVACTDDASSLVVDALAGPGLAAPLSMTARAGEIVGVCGLVGCGARELAGLLGGALAPQDGSAHIDGDRLPLGHPAALRDAGCGYIPGDRQREGGVFTLSIRENLFLSRRGRLASAQGSVLRRGGPERRDARALTERFDVRPRGVVDRPLSSLSGGNQQKVVCGRAMRTRPRLLVVDDPTAGVDVGSRAQIHDTLRAAAADGAVIVLASTDYEEVAALADRALVMVAGRVHAELRGGELTPDQLARASYGTGAPERSTRT
jgi:ribose transport system ATP-binding protein